MPQEEYDTLKEDYEVLHSHLEERASGTEEAEQSAPAAAARQQG